MEKIPGFSRYSISRDGKVRNDEVNGWELETTKANGHRYVVLKRDDWKMVAQKISRLVMLTYRPLSGFDSDWCSVMFKDGKISHISLDNMWWDTEGYVPEFDGLLPENQDRYLSIPGFSRYELTPQGALRNRDTSKDLCAGAIAAVGYHHRRMVTDRGRSTILYNHRALALTSLKHPWDVDHLVINHIDTDTLNNRLSNLEWATFTRNLVHARQEGLRSDSGSTVYTKNPATGDITKHESYNECARCFGVNPGSVFMACRASRDPAKLWRGLYISRDPAVLKALPLSNPLQPQSPS